MLRLTIATVLGLRRNSALECVGTLASELFLVPSARTPPVCIIAVITVDSLDHLTHRYARLEGLWLKSKIGHLQGLQ